MKFKFCCDGKLYELWKDSDVQLTVKQLLSIGTIMSRGMIKTQYAVENNYAHNNWPNTALCIYLLLLSLHMTMEGARVQTSVRTYKFT